MPENLGLLWLSFPIIFLGIYAIMEQELTITTFLGPITIRRGRLHFFGLICLESAALPILFVIMAHLQQNPEAVDRYGAIPAAASIALPIFGFLWAAFFELLHRLRYGPPGK